LTETQVGWSLREHQKEPDRLGQVLYWQQLLAPTDEAPGDVVWQNDHSLFSVLRYRGPDMESADAYDLMSLNARLHHNVLLTLGAGWTLHAEERRHAAPAYPVSTWSHPVAALVDEERRCQVGAPGSHFVTDYHLTLTRQIPRGLGSWWQRLWWEHIPQGHAQIDVVQSFREEIARVTQQLQGLFVDVDVLTGDALTTYLHNTVSEHWQDVVHVPEPPWWLNYDLTDTGLYAGVTPMLGDLWLRPIVVKNEGKQTCLPPTTYPGILDILHDLPLEYRYVWRWIPLSHAAARKELSDLENLYQGQVKPVSAQFAAQWGGTGADKRNEGPAFDAKQMSEAKGLLDQGVVQWGYQSLTVLVWDQDFALAEQKRELVEQALRAKGFLASVEKIDAVGAFLGMLPGDSYHNVERPMVTSFNACHLFPSTSVWSGATWVPHLNGPPLLTATARGQTPFGVTTHDRDVGDYFFVAPKGAGKSAATCLMELGFQRYENPGVIIFDKGASHKAATLAMDGLWVDLSPATARPLQPFARIHDMEERAWAIGLVQDILDLEGLTRTPTQTTLVEAAMKTLANSPIWQRTMTGLMGLVQDDDVRKALLRYTVDGDFPVLDGDEDWLRVTHWTCFEMENLLDNFAHFVPPVAKVLFRRVETSLVGNPTMMTLEECHAYFQVPVLAQRLFQWVKTFRRKNVMMGWLTQNLRDMLGSPIGLEIIDACPTRFYGANPHAIEAQTMALYQQFGLSPRQCEIIAHLIPALEVYYTGRGGARRFKLEMGPITLAYCGRSRQEDLARMATVDRTRTEPFGVAWLRAEGLETQAALLGEAYGEQEKVVPAPSVVDRHELVSLDTVG
jgi:type IV secretion system protein TrbE